MQCDMENECTGAVTHIGEKGYIYCTEHAIERRRFVGENTRKMRKWEIELIKAGQPLPSYKPLPKPKPKPPELSKIRQDSESLPSYFLRGYDCEHKRLSPDGDCLDCGS